MEEIPKLFDGDDAVDVGEVADVDMNERGLETTVIDAKDVTVTHVGRVEKA